MRVLIKKRSDFPKCIRHFKELKGICIGECAYVLNSPEYRDADPFKLKGHSMHAHSDTLFQYSGWICMHYKCQLKDKMVLLHEVAHLLVGGVGLSHGKEWKKMVVSIGGSFKEVESNDGNYVYPDYTYRHR